MKSVRSLKSLRKELARLRAAGKTIGFVPTMGYFHAGHLALMRRAKKECDVCVVSIFVNPRQFGPSEDFARYPRDLKRDTRMAKDAGVDILFIPETAQVYPEGYATSVEVDGVSEGLCGAVRPGHFRGVATVVLKLLNMVSPDRIFLGQKDAQQVAVIRRMIKDLDVPVRLRVVPTVREPDGLAMSSRNVYLSADERRQAVSISAALLKGRAMIRKGALDAEQIISTIKKLLPVGPGASIEYLSCVDPTDMQPVRRIKGQVLLAAAVRFPSARLIDNVVCSPRGECDEVV